jgi:hypothetical protein
MSFDDVARRMTERAGSSLPPTSELVTPAVQEGARGAHTRSALLGVLMLAVAIVWFCLLAVPGVDGGHGKFGCAGLAIGGFLLLVRGPGSQIDRMARRDDI